MQAETNLQDTNIQYEVSEKMPEGTSDDVTELIVTNSLNAGIYTLELNSNKRLCIVTFLTQEQGTFSKPQLTDLVGQAHRLQLLEEKLFSAVRNVSESDLTKMEGLLNIVSTLNFEDAIIEFSAFNSLIFKLKFADNLLLIINVPEENLTDENPTAVFSLLEDRKIVVDNYNTLENIVIGMQTFLDQ